MTFNLEVQDIAAIRHGCSGIKLSNIQAMETTKSREGCLNILICETQWNHYRSLIGIFEYRAGLPLSKRLISTLDEELFSPIDQIGPNVLHY